jgi:hypothetical protein
MFSGFKPTAVLSNDFAHGASESLSDTMALARQRFAAFGNTQRLQTPAIQALGGSATHRSQMTLEGKTRLSAACGIT